jgi:3-hydroxyisobutyrate dehydrogenase-like beta-hydroxyacid dehydrogenase
MLAAANCFAKLGRPCSKSVFRRPRLVQVQGSGVSTSTIRVELAKRMKKEYAQRGREYVGAPMFGRPEAVREAKLISVTGSAPSSISRLQPIFKAIGRLSFTAGAEPWHANLFKLCGNFIISSMLETWGSAGRWVGTK